VCVYVHQVQHVPKFSPELIRPHPKAGPRKAIGQRRRKRTTEILTDSPVKETIEKEKKRSYMKVKRKIMAEKKEGGKRRKKSTEDTKCLVCDEWFSSSRPGEKWVSCSRCSMWSHEECTLGGDSYICHHCESDT